MKKEKEKSKELCVEIEKIYIYDLVQSPGFGKSILSLVQFHRKIRIENILKQI